MPTLTTAYCDLDDVRTILSEHGCALALDDDDNAALSATETSNGNTLLGWSAAQMNQWLRRRYAVDAMQQSDWVRRANATLAARDFRKRRGNPCPESLEGAARDILDDCRRIGLGQLSLFDATPSFQAGPAVTNYGVDMRYPRTQVRVVPATSSGQRPSGDTIRRELPEFNYGDYI